MGSLVACGGSGSEEYNNYFIVECDNPDSPYKYWEGRYLDKKGRFAEYRYSDERVPTEYQLKEDDKYLWFKREEIRYEYYGDCTPEQTLTKPTPISNLSQCKSDLQAVANNLNTYDDDYYDRLFKKSLQSCETAYTWNSYAPSSIANQLSAACILYSDYPVCKN